MTGAGDTVISVLAAALAAGQDLVDAMTLANLAAGVVVGKLGTATASVAELRRALREQDDVQHGVVSEERLIELVQEAKLHGETVVRGRPKFVETLVAFTATARPRVALQDRFTVRLCLRRERQQTQKRRACHAPEARAALRTTRSHHLASQSFCVLTSSSPRPARRA